MKFERLGNKIIQVRGISFNPKDISGSPLKDYVPVLKANNISERGINTANLIYIHRSKVKPEQFIKKGDLLLAASSGSKDIVGKNIYFENDFDGSFGAFCKLVRPNEKINPNFLGVFFKTPNFKRHIRKLIQGALINNLKNEHINSLQIPSLSFSDQIQIANILNKTEALIEQRKQSLSLIDNFLKSIFIEMFGDPMSNPKNLRFTKLENLCSKIVDCPHSTPIKSKSPTNYPCIRTSELKDGYISWESMQYLEEDEYKKRTQRLIPFEGDIVYGREGTFGDAVRLPATHKFSLGQRTMLFRPDYTKCNTNFLWAMLRSDFVYKQAKKKNSGSTVGHVNVKDIKQFNLFHPPMELQTQFSNIVNKIEILKEQYKTSLNELENLYGSLSQKAFNGELEFLQPVIATNDPSAESYIDSEKNKEKGKAQQNKKPVSKKTKEVSTSERINQILEASKFYPATKDIFEFIQKYFSTSLFTFKELEELIKLAMWEYDFENIKGHVFDLLREKKITQIFADATYKSSINIQSPDFEAIQKLEEKIYLKRTID